MNTKKIIGGKRGKRKKRNRDWYVKKRKRPRPRRIRKGPGGGQSGEDCQAGTLT